MLPMIAQICMALKNVMSLIFMWDVYICKHFWSFILRQEKIENLEFRFCFPGGFFCRTPFLFVRHIILQKHVFYSIQNQNELRDGILKT